MREADTLNKLSLFERIDLVGAGGDGLAAKEHVNGNINIHRLDNREGRRGLVQKALFMFQWSVSVFRKYRGESLACINCHSLSTLPIGLLLKRATGAKIIYDAHELETEANGLGGIRKLLSKIVERALIGYADYSIFVGDLINDWYREKYSLANSEVIYNCPRFRAATDTNYFREKFNLPENIPIFIYQGVISEGRGVRACVEAFDALEGKAILVVLGYGPLADWISKLADEKENIYYHEAVQPGELHNYTAAADYGLSIIESTALSYEYCMPNKLFEYVMARIPVLVSPTREQKQFVERQQVGAATTSTKPDDIKSAVLKLLDLGSDSFMPAVESTAKEYCWETQEAKLERIYLELLSEGDSYRQAAGVKT